MLEMLGIGFLRLAFLQEQIHLMNPRILVTMICDDPLCQQMMPVILEAILKIGRSEPMTTVGSLAVAMIIELLQIAIESEDGAVAGDNESILTRYEND
jgi:hypothetical protein